MSGTSAMVRHMQFLRGAHHSWMLFAAAVVLTAGLAPAAGADSQLYSYGEACHGAMSDYRQGWAEILENGRWTDSERLYRKVVAAAPDCLIAKSVLARITIDADERESLIEDIQSNIDKVDVHDRWLLDPYLKTLLLINARDTGQSLGEGFRDDLTSMAVRNYRAFLDEYPGEWAVRIEYIEWIHAAQGPQGALEAIGEMSSEGLSDNLRLSYFPAYFHAELGEYSQAIELAQAFVQQLGPGDWPQEHYITAFIDYQRGQYSAAAESIKHALQLDPRHLIAERLSKKIDKALETEH